MPFRVDAAWRTTGMCTSPKLIAPFQITRGMRESSANDVPGMILRIVADAGRRLADVIA
jgi:hypothetical protein